MITTSKLSKKYKYQLVLNKINFSFPKKGLVFIKGVSGGGKTTFLNIIGGLLNDYDGNIYFKNEKMNKKENANYFQNKSSYIFQTSNLIEGISLKENLLLVYKINSNLKYNEKKFDELTKKMNLREVLNKKVKFLSQGEKQRATIFRGILCDNDVLLADEPTGSLNKENADMILELLVEISKQKLVVVVTHNEDLIRNHDNVVELEKGKFIGKIILANKKDENYNKSINKFKKLNLKNLFKISFMYYKLRFKKMFSFAFFVSLFVVSFFLLGEIVDVFKINFIDEISDYNNYYMVNKKNIEEEFLLDDYQALLPIFSDSIKDHFVEIINSDMYSYKVSLSSKQIGNGFLISKMRYINYNLNENELILGGDLNSICKQYNLNECSYNKVKNFVVNSELHLQINQKTSIFIIKEYIETDEFVLYSNNYNKNQILLNEVENNIYNYYFVVDKNKKHVFFNTINDYDNLDAFLVSSDINSYIYKLEKAQQPYFVIEDLKELNFDYIYCLENGYNCLANYGDGGFKNLNFIKYKNKKIQNGNVQFKAYNNELLDINEINISSALARDLKYNNLNEEIIFVFDNNYVSLKIKSIIPDNEYYIYQNSFWTYNFFQQVLNIEPENLRSALLYSKNINELSEDELVFTYLYEDVISEIVQSIDSTTKYVIYLIIFLNITNFFMIILLQYIEMLEFRKFVVKIKMLGLNKKDTNNLVFIINFLTFMICILFSFVCVCLTKLILSYNNLFLNISFISILQINLIIGCLIFISSILPLFSLNKKKLIDLLNK